MSTAVQLRRGTTVQHSTFTGSEGEVTVDTTKDTVVVHDGTTVGGHPLLKEAAIGVSVQAYDADLTTLGNGGDSARTFLGLAIGTDVQAYDADTAKTDVVQSFSVAQRGAATALTSSSASIATNLALANNFTHTLTESTTLANPTNITAGQSGVIVFTQHASSPKTLAFGSYWKFPSGTAPSLTATNSAVDVLAYYVESSTRITARMLSDVK
jgi:hypothetical protein